MSKEEQRVAAIEAILQSIRVGGALRTKTNEELAKLMIDHVWADEPIMSAKSDLIDEVIERLRLAPNQIRPDDDEEASQ